MSLEIINNVYYVASESDLRDFSCNLKPEWEKVRNFLFCFIYNTFLPGRGRMPLKETIIYIYIYI